MLTFVGDWLPKCALTNGRGNSVKIGNLECAFSDGEIVSGKAYTSVLPESCLPHVGTGGFGALSLANNHVNDAGNFEATYEELKRRFPQIQFFGTVDNPYATFAQSSPSEVGSIHCTPAPSTCIYIIGCLEPCRSRSSLIFKQEDIAALVKEIKQSRNPTIQQFIYIYPHWGMEGEYTRYPSPKQRALARAWIDAGADGVFGSHSHVPQGRERYRGKPIYYSLGNFDFDHPESKLYEGTMDRLAVQIDEKGCVEECFSSDEARRSVERASRDLANWNTWKWAQKIGSFNIRKNMASWRIRLSKNLLKTLPKFIVWQFMPKTILFRLAGLWH